MTQLPSFDNRFPKFGNNKERETKRLIFEIAKIKKQNPDNILSSIKDNNYEAVKKSLLALRYPKTFKSVPANSFYLPKYEIQKEYEANLTSNEFYPKNIYYVNKAKDSKVFQNLKNLFPKTNFIEIESLKSFLKEKTFSISDFNNRCDNLFLIEEKYDFFKKCPCTTGVINCGYSIMNLGMGCPYECNYCFLQGYQNVAGIIIPYNIDDYLIDEKIVSSTKGFFNYKRIGSGEFTDSLVFDHITEFSKSIIDFFKTRKDINFEFKTKSINTKNVLEAGGKENIVIAWSMNALKIQKENEFKTPDILQRLNAAKEVAKAGFSTSFHFDPIIPYDNWKAGYKETIDMIFDIVPNESIKWISLGTLRMPAILKPIIENRFPQNEILDGELLLGNDYKLRFHETQRVEIYKYMTNLIKSKKSPATVYLCMETNEVWQKSNIND